MTKKLGFCFLIYDRINLEKIWRNFFQNVNPDKYGIYIHYKPMSSLRENAQSNWDKTNPPLQYFEHCKLDNCIETEYAKVSLVHAHNLLFTKAYQDGCDKIISLSQACIPFKSFDYIYNFLTRDNYGHFNITVNQAGCFPRCNSLLQYYSKDDIQKSSNWFILNRTICQTILTYTKEEIDAIYGEIDSPEEHYYITSIYANKLQDEIITTPNLTDRATTFINWHDMEYIYSNPDDNGLKNYSYITNDEIEHLCKAPCLFGRKFNTECFSILFENPPYKKTTQI